MSGRRAPFGFGDVSAFKPQQPQQPLCPLEGEIRLSSGITLATLTFGDTAEQDPKRRIFAVHGTLDNAASYIPLGELLAPLGYTLCAVDLSGCGRSSWRSDGFYSREKWVKELWEALRLLGWDKCVIMGHSLGQGLVSVLAGTFPELFVGVVLIEGFGWWSAGLSAMSADGTFGPAASLRRKILRIDEVNKRGGAKVYASLDAAVEARVNGNGRNPDSIVISRRAAQLLVERGTAPAPEGGGGCVKFIHDTRCASLEQYYSHEEAGSFLKLMPTTLLLNCDPAKTYASIPARMKARIPTGLRPKVLKVCDFPGESHHLHMDAPQRVLPAILEWLRALPGGGNDPSVYRYLDGVPKSKL